MNPKTKIVFTILLLFLWRTIEAQHGPLWSGHIAFSQGKYEEALKLYQKALSEGNKWNWLPEHIEIVSKRKSLGSLPPAYIHRVGIIYITQLNEVNGSRIKKTSDVTQSQKSKWWVNFNLLKQTIESLSNGAWSLSFDTINATSTFSKAITLKPENPDLLDLEQTFFKTMNDFDSYITVSNTVSPALGLARQYPYINGVLYGPHRGMVLINAGAHDYDVLLHEFFHIVEYASGVINVAHGFQNDLRKNFPEWAGQTELDYYKWHYENTIPPLGWKKLNHTTRWVKIAADSESYDLLRRAYATIPIADRLRAKNLSAEGMAMKSTNLTGAVAKWEEAVALSPYLPEALAELHDYYRFTAPNKSKEIELYDRLHSVRRVNDFSTINTENEHYGTVAASWHREDIRQTWNDVVWDVTPAIRSLSANCYVATFYYTSGWKALDIDSVYLQKDGVNVALDAHIGFSGTAKRNIEYHLALPDFSSTATYHLVARVKGNNGVDSEGQIHIRSSTADGCPTALKK